MDPCKIRAQHFQILFVRYLMSIMVHIGMIYASSTFESLLLAINRYKDSNSLLKKAQVILFVYLCLVLVKVTINRYTLSLISILMKALNQCIYSFC